MSKKTIADILLNHQKKRISTIINVSSYGYNSNTEIAASSLSVQSTTDFDDIAPTAKSSSFQINIHPSENINLETDVENIINSLSAINNDMVYIIENKKEIVHKEIIEIDLYEITLI